MDLEEVDERGYPLSGSATDPAGKSSPPNLIFCALRPLANVRRIGSRRCRIDIRLVPAAVEVTRLIFARDEATVEVGFLAPGALEGVDRAAEAVEQAASVRCCTESGVHFVPLGKVDAGWKQAVYRQSRQHNTTIMLC